MPGITSNFVLIQAFRHWQGMETRNMGQDEEHTDMDRQRRHQAAFIGYALGSGRQYTGKSMAKAHEGMNLQPEHYDAIVGHLADTLKHFQVSDEDIREVEKTIGTLRDDILYK